MSVYEVKICAILFKMHNKIRWFDEQQNRQKYRCVIKYSQMLIIESRLCKCDYSLYDPFNFSYIQKFF